eukprot:1888202-Prymnesium_polylepis.1
MPFAIIEWSGDRFQWSVQVPSQLKEIYLRKGFVLLPPYSTHPAVRLDVYFEYEYLMNPVIPVAGNATVKYPPFAPERMSSDGTLECGL